MNKAKAIAIVIGAVLLIYAMLSVAIVFLADTSTSVNADLASSFNMSQYWGVSEFLLASPWILYFVPGVVGLIIIIVILKRREPGV